MPTARCTSSDRCRRVGPGCRAHRRGRSGRLGARTPARPRCPSARARGRRSPVGGATSGVGGIASARQGCAAALLDYAELAVERHTHLQLLPRAWQLRDAVSAYDAQYVALAELLGVALVTADGRLSRASGCAATSTCCDDSDPGLQLRRIETGYGCGTMTCRRMSCCSSVGVGGSSRSHSSCSSLKHSSIAGACRIGGGAVRSRCSRRCGDPASSEDEIVRPAPGRFVIQRKVDVPQ